MAANTAIEWTDATWNPVGGCSIHSPGCGPCYAMKLAAHARLNKHPLYAGTTEIVKGKAVWNGKLTVLPDDHEAWTWPLRWRGATSPAHPPKLGPGNPSLIFVADMSDLFHNDRPREHIDRVVAAILHSKHIGQLLTKRPNVMCEYFEDLMIAERWRDFVNPITGRSFAQITEANFPDDLPMRRLWLGCSAERQQEADARKNWMRDLADIGFTTFVSYEPALGPVDWTGWEFLKQLIAGGMSGEDAKPSFPDWFANAQFWCAEHGVAFFFKQWGEWAVWDEESAWTFERHAAAANDGRTWANLHRVPLDTPVAFMERVGKKRAGRLVAGIEHNGFPEVA